MVFPSTTKFDPSVGSELVEVECHESQITEYHDHSILDSIPIS